jgi:hypothetical protein
MRRLIKSALMPQESSCEMTIQVGNDAASRRIRRRIKKVGKDAASRRTRVVVQDNEIFQQG